MRKINRPPPSKNRNRQQERTPVGPPSIPTLPSGPLPPEWQKLLKKPPQTPPMKKAFFAWADKNVQLISKYPNSYLAVDIRDNRIALAEQDQQTFIEKYLALPPQDHTILFSFHTSLYGF
jgi:hypothetical protein